jgi:hypothetical protein
LELEKFSDFSGMVVERLNGVQKARALDLGR